MTNSLSISVRAFNRCLLMSFSVDEMLLPRLSNLFFSFREPPFRVEMSPLCLKHIYSVLSAFTWRPMWLLPDGNWTRMLRAILNSSWKWHPTKQQMHLPPISKTIQIRWTRHVGHYWRSKHEIIRDVLLWISSHGRVSVGRPARTYLQQLCMDPGCNLENQPEAMYDIGIWRERDFGRSMFAAHVCLFVCFGFMAYQAL